MADSSQTKTEQPTPRRLEQSREKGQIAYSSDLIAGIVLLVISLTMMIIGDWFLKEFTERIAKLLSAISWAGKTEGSWILLVQQSLWDAAVLSIPFAAVGFISTAVFGGMLTGFQISPKAIKWDPTKLDPVQGFKKIFSSRAVVRGVFSILKLVVLTAIVITVLRWNGSRISWSGMGTASSMALISWQLITQIAVAVSAALVLIGLADLLFQKWKHMQDMRMTRQEVQDERREDEGDPHLRARIKKLQREMSQRRMLADVPAATVVITNPTHLAIAIRYERGQAGAPLVVAKGADQMARKIVQIARANQVAVVQRKPLARMLFASVEVGDQIPLELYQSVAEVLAYIYRIEQSI